MSRLTPEFHRAMAVLTTAYAIHFLDAARPREALAQIREATEELLATIDAEHQRQRTIELEPVPARVAAAAD
jgi:hypothetical protein